MYDALLVNGLEGLDQACNHKLGAVRRKLANARVVIPQIASFHQVHDEVQALYVVEGPLDVDNEIAVYASHDFQLLHHRLDALLGHDPGFQHFLHSVHLAILLNSQHFTECASADGVVVLEVLLRYQLAGFIALRVLL